MADTDGTPSLKTLTINNETSKEVTLPQGELEAKSEAAAFPEGGFRAWATVAGAFLVRFCGFGYTTSFGVYQGNFRIGVHTIRQLGSAVLRFLHARIFDRIFSLGNFIFLAQGIGAGIGSGTMYVPSIAVVSHYFQKHRALAMAIVATGAPLGGVVHPIMLNNTLRSLGFENAIRASAGLISGLLIIAALLMRPRLPPPVTHLPFWKSLRRFSRDRAYVFTSIGIATYAIGVYFPIFYLQLNAVKHGINTTLSFYSLVMMNAASVVGRLAPGFFAERVGILKVLMVAAGCGTVFILAFLLVLTTDASVVDENLGDLQIRTRRKLAVRPDAHAVLVGLPAGMVMECKSNNVFHFVWGSWIATEVVGGGGLCADLFLIIFTGFCRL
ncbi:major facilitator superfamily domain-containing protein [Mycena albidolilacea]|uniref:Major facilitator superfamily domain-containing protein n=1 Tax=Mycena albidolilacea TaxID=1033008 RepID=A0AAD6ZR87_9AGAR|nr:major facilitator superfamily domain-containing protein [Mycena albidolilacea]